MEVTADGNTFRYNLARSTCGANCLTSASPAIDRAGTSPAAFDLDGRPVPQNGDCAGTAAADSGAYEFDSPNC
ncbi:MAG TPA: choice-of-anchor Q domain-containing protein [Arthrobacter sp.]|nr:choice-of-anchor Q domain-containing protein [Arthrobacter sp.]